MSSSKKKDLRMFVQTVLGLSSDEKFISALDLTEDVYCPENEEHEVKQEILYHLYNLLEEYYEEKFQQTVTRNKGRLISDTLILNPEKVSYRIAPDVSITLVKIPRIKFYFGGKKYNSGPISIVNLEPFFISCEPITVQQWNAVRELEQDFVLLVKKADADPDSYVFNVSYAQAKEFCSRLSKHLGINLSLPSETQVQGLAAMKSERPESLGFVQIDDKPELVEDVYVSSHSKNKLDGSPVTT